MQSSGRLKAALEAHAQTKMPVVVGDVVAGKFRVEEVLGEGGMGIVVAATHLQLRETVALKFLRSEFVADEKIVARFAHEARAAVKLKGEHVARVLDVGSTEDGTPFFVMEHLHGRDLRTALQEQGAFDSKRATEYAIQACEGLAEAHARGLVHRDVKPENLFVVERDGWSEIKVLDFGISTAVFATPEEIAQLSGEQLLGSPWYMAPERFLLSSDEVDLRSDIWSLGVVLYEMLSGTTPLDPTLTVPHVLKALKEGTPTRSLRDMHRGLSRELVDLVEKCLARDRNHRFQNTAELAVALLPFAPRRSRAIVERTVSMTLTAGLGDSSLALPPSNFPSAPTGGVDPLRIEIPRLPTLDASTLSPTVPKSDVAVAALPPEPRSKNLKWLGVVGGVAVLAIGAVFSRRGDSSSAPAAAPTSASASAPATAGGVPSSNGSAIAAEPTPIARTRIDSIPAGANVREDGVEVCAATPCFLTYESADPKREHELVIAKTGFRSATIVVQVGTPSASVKLETSARAASSKATPTPSGATTTIDGFKDIPY